MVFRTYRSNGKSFIERLTYPRFTAEITFNPDGATDIENIEWIDEPPMDEMFLARLMRLTTEFLIKGHQIEEE